MEKGTWLGGHVGKLLMLHCWRGGWAFQAAFWGAKILVYKRMD